MTSRGLKPYTFKLELDNYGENATNSKLNKDDIEWLGEKCM